MPYPNEHSCRLEDPDKYDRFTRGECDQKHDGKCIDVIYGWHKKEGKEVSETQALRYGKKVWTEESARNHCKSRGGSFEAASDEKEGSEQTASEKYQCECIKCGHKMESEKHCNEIKCEKCGGQMRRVGRPGPGQSQKGDIKMDIVTTESFQVAYPDLYKQITDKATEEGFKGGFEKGKTEGAEQERARIKGVEEQLIPGHEELITSLKFDGKTTGPEAAVKILNAEKTIRWNIKTDLEKDTVKPLTQPPVSVEIEGVNPNLPVEERAKQTWDKSPAIREEFLGNYASYLAWMKQSEAGNVRILKKERSKGGKE
jgi:hypothetical protein